MSHDPDRQSSGRFFIADVKLMKFVEGKKLHPSTWRLMVSFKPLLFPRTYFFSSVRALLEQSAHSEEELLKTVFEPYLSMLMYMSDYHKQAGIQRRMEIYGYMPDKGFSAEMKDLSLLGGCPQEVRSCSVRFESFVDTFLDILKRIDVLYKHRREEVAEAEKSFSIEADRPQASFILL